MSRITGHFQMDIEPVVGAFRRWWMRGQKRVRRNLQGGVILVGLGILLLATSQGAEEQPIRGFVAWSAMRSPEPCVVKVDPQRRWVAQWEVGWGECPIRVWSLRSDWTLGDEVLNTRGKGVVGLGMEWMGSRLLIKVVEGVKTHGELDKQPPYKTEEEARGWWAKNLKLVVWDPQAPERWEPQGGYYEEIGGLHDGVEAFGFLAHPSGGKVVGVSRRGIESPARTLRVFGFPLAPAARAGAQRIALPSPIVRERCVPLFWCADGERLWAMGSDQRQFGKVAVVGLDGTVKTLTPDDHEVGPGDVYGKGALVITPMRPVLVRGGKQCAALMSSQKKKHVCIGYYSAEKLEEERVIVGWQEPYPASLEPLGRCTLLTVTPDGGRLVLQQGRFAPPGQKEQVWVWDMDRGTLKPVATVGWITQVYDWIGAEGMVVEMKGDPGSRERPSTFEYGMLRISGQ